MNQKNNQNQALLDVWEVLVRFRWRFIIPAFAVAAAVLAASLFVPRKYRGEATFERRTDMVLAEILNRGGTASYQDPRQSLAEEISGQPAIDALRDSLAKLPETKSLQQVRDWDRQTFYAEVGRKIVPSYDISSNELDRVRIAYVAEDPVLARAVVNTLVLNYMARTRARIDDRMRESSDFFQAEVDRNRTLIEDLETKKLTFEIDHGALLPENPNNIQTLLSEAQNALTAAKQQHDATAVRVEALRKSLQDTPETTPLVVMGRNPDLVRMEDKLRDLEGQYAQYVGPLKMTDKHPELVALKQQIAALKDRIQGTAQEVVTSRQIGTNPKRGEVELLLTNATTEQQAQERAASQLQTRVDQLTAQSANLFPVRSDYMKLTRQIDDAQRQLAFWEDNLRRVGMAMTAETGKRGVQMEFIKPCDAIGRPVSPNLLQVLAAAVALGLLAGGLGVFFAHRTDETFRDADQLSEACKLPALGAINELITARQRRNRRLRQVFFYPANVLAMALVIAVLGGLLYLNLERPARFEQLKQNPVRFLRQQISPAAATADPGPSSQE